MYGFLSEKFKGIYSLEVDQQIDYINSLLEDPILNDDYEPETLEDLRKYRDKINLIREEYRKLTKMADETIERINDETDINQN